MSFRFEDSCRAAGGLLLLLGVLSIGCRSESARRKDSAPEVPRPVNVLLVARGHTPGRSRVSASVSPWKQESIGFQVSGRIQQVVEIGREVVGRVFDGDGERLLVPGTLIAKLDDERLQVAVQSAEAAVEVASRRKEAVQVEIETGFPARLRSQKAELSLAQRELQRAESLAGNNAISNSERERVVTNYETALANEAMIVAEQKAREAELRSLEADILRAQNALSEAKLNLRDASLFSSFRGQVAGVHVVPGSIVRPGEPVVTVQMMDPIRIAFEVSAEEARHYRYADSLRVLVGKGDRPLTLPGFVLMTDPVADPKTRTFTVSLLVPNERKLTPVPDDLQSSVVARTHDVWPVRMERLIGVGTTLMMEESAIRHDEQGAFIWRVTNRQAYEVQKYSPLLPVSRTRVQVGKGSVSFLNWKFVPIQFESSVDFDPERALFAGDLKVSEGSKDEWDGNVILFDEEDWTLRPGDTVQVERAPEGSENAFYIPVKAIRLEGGRSYIFLVREENGTQFARRYEIRLSGPDQVDLGESTLVAIQPVGAEFPEQLPLIVEGVHYLVDGDAITVARKREALR